MIHLTKNQAVNIQPGNVIVGKWQRNRYKIIKRLGYGSIGAVYLVQSQLGLSALKIGYDKVGIISEVNALKRLTNVQGQSLGPFFIEMDDWNGWTYYVMEYLQGEPLLPFIQQKGSEWIAVFMLQLLSELDNLHRENWVFGDLKPENLLVVGPAPKIRWLDVGGVTQIGRSIKEFTSFFDRAHWGAGSRRAEPSYDLFSFVMVFLNLAYPRQFSKNGEGIRQLERKIMMSPFLKKYASILIGALKSQYSNAAEMRLHLLQEINGGIEPISARSRVHLKKKKRRKRSKLKVVIVMTLVILIFLLYLEFNGG